VYGANLYLYMGAPGFLVSSICILELRHMYNYDQYCNGYLYYDRLQHCSLRHVVS